MSNTFRFMIYVFIAAVIASALHEAAIKYASVWLDSAAFGSTFAIAKYMGEKGINLF